MSITALPTAPSRADPANFAVRADAFLGALQGFATEANALQVDVNDKQVAAANSANAAAVSASNASTSATNALASANSAAASADVTQWNPATNYSAGVNVYDTTDFLTYRRKISGTTTNRPGIDPTNWELISGNVTLQTNQTITGIKTFSQRIVGDINGNSATADALTDNTVLCPTGMVGYFVNTAAPSGWLKANGALVSRSTYAALFSVLGTTYGVGDGSTTFALPDFRGEFLRAWDDGRGVDASRALNTSQSSQNLEHTHTGSAQSAGAHTHNISTTSGGVNVSGQSLVSFQKTSVVANVANAALSAGDHTHVLTVDSSGGTESRPRNFALLACIKY